MEQRRKLKIFKRAGSPLFRRSAHKRPDRNFYYTTSPPICQGFFEKKLHKIIFPKLCIIFLIIFKNLLTFPSLCGILLVSRDKGNNLQGWREWTALAKTAHYNNPPKIFQKLLKSLLTKPQKCGILLVSRGSPQDTIKGEQVHRVKKFLQNFLKNPLTNSTKCGIIKVQKRQTGANNLSPMRSWVK